MIEELAKRLFKDIGSVNIHTINENQTEMIRSIQDLEKFLVYNFQHYNASFNIGLLLTFPFLFNSFTNNNWINLLTQNSPRKPTNKLISNPDLLNEDGTFTDLIFLHKYLGIDTLDLMLRIKHKIDSNEFEFSVQFIKKYAYKFFVAESELKEDLEDFYSIGMSDLSSYRNQLIAHGFKNVFRDARELKMACQKVLDSI
ncbi:MAG: hypothetical protein Crog4KO_07530 [Crocinitomicaceae bacterium]